MNAQRVYLDHNSTTPLRPEVRELLHELLDAELANPSSLHRSGRAARHRIDTARERVAAALGVLEDEVVFTSGGTESNGLALWGGLEALGPGAVLATSTVEHSAVLEVARRREESGGRVVWLDVDARARVDLDAAREALAAESGPLLLSVQLANNEVGTLQPVAELAAAARRREGPSVVHTDAVQALGRVPLAPAELGADVVSLSAHKVGGPVGVGVLVRRQGAPLLPRALGGGQEAGLRAGTESATLIAGAALAVELAVRDQQAFRDRVGGLTESLWTAVREAIPDAVRLGEAQDREDRLPNTLAVLIPGTDGKVLVTALDLAGVEVSAGSACASGSLEPSHVLRAMGHDDDEARAGLRLSLGWNTTADDCQRAVDVLRKVAASSRAT